MALTVVQPHSEGVAPKKPLTTDHERDELANSWAEYIGPAAPMVRRRIWYWGQQLDAGVLEYAITETAYAPRPSLRYFDAICRRLLAENLITYKALMNRMEGGAFFE